MVTVKLIKMFKSFYLKYSLADSNIMRGSSRSCTYLARCICMRYCTKSGGKNGNLQLPPEPTNCCMQGCANCVWIAYAETLLKIFDDGGEKAREIIMSRVSDPNMRAFLETELRIIKMKAEQDKNK